MICAKCGHDLTTAIEILGEGARQFHAWIHWNQDRRDAIARNIRTLRKRARGVR